VVVVAAVVVVVVVVLQFITLPAGYLQLRSAHVCIYKTLTFLFTCWVLTNATGSSGSEHIYRPYILSFSLFIFLIKI